MWEGLFSNSLWFVIFPSHLLVSGFGFQPLNIFLGWAYDKKKNKYSKEKNKKSKFSLIKSICFIKINKT